MKLRSFLSTKAGHTLAGLAVVVGVLGGYAAASGAAVATAITSGFATAQSGLLSEMGLGVALVIAVMLFGLGIRMLVKWSRAGLKAG